SLPIIPTVSGYGPRVSVGETAQVELLGVVVGVVVVSAAVGDPLHAAMAAAPTPAPSAASASRRSIFLVFGKYSIPGGWSNADAIAIGGNVSKTLGPARRLSLPEVNPSPPGPTIRLLKNRFREHRVNALGAVDELRDVQVGGNRTQHVG